MPDGPVIRHEHTIPITRIITTGTARVRRWVAWTAARVIAIVAGMAGLVVSAAGAVRGARSAILVTVGFGCQVIAVWVAWGPVAGLVGLGAALIVLDHLAD